jgi:tRNA(fMet)-specific endonuclease VapC
MSRVILDTDMLSEVLKGRDATVAARASAYLAGHGIFVFTVVTVMEIVDGLERVGRRDKAEAFAASLVDAEVLPFDAASAERAGRIHAMLRAKGRQVDLPDVMIAAIALGERLPIVTGNMAHYHAIRDAGYPLQVETWRA